ncbi:MAG: hypothetical protein ABI434_08660 [Burkholderiaceae bacterium]
MEKSNPPRSFGVFKPTGHTVIAFESVALLETAVKALGEQGFVASEIVRYTPQEMLAQTDSDLVTASGMASVGQELNLIKAHRELAQKGSSFLVVSAPDDDQAKRVDTVIHGMHTTAAQRYGTFIVEELVDKADGDNQVFESPDRGLDMDVQAITHR